MSRLTGRTGLNLLLARAVFNTFRHADREREKGKRANGANVCRFWFWRAAIFNLLQGRLVCRVLNDADCAVAAYLLAFVVAYLGSTLDWEIYLQIGCLGRVF